MMINASLHIGDVLSQLLKEHGLNESELGRKINLPRATINRLVSKRTSNPRTDTLKIIADYFDISLEQLMGKIPLLKNEQSEFNLNIPILKWEYLPFLRNSDKEAYDQYDGFIALDSFSQSGDFAIKVEGDSMWPQFQEGSLLIIDTKRNPKNRDFILVYIKSEDQFLFRQFIVDGKYKFIQAINTIFPILELKEEDKILGVLIQRRNEYV